MTLDPRFQAAYDADGNIILRQARMEPVLPDPADAMPPPELKNLAVEEEDGEWSIDTWEEEVVVSANGGGAVFQETGYVHKRALPRVDVAQLVTAISEVTRDALSEGLHQYKSSVRGAVPVLQETTTSAGTLLERLWRTLSQPVWIPTRRKTLRQYSRGSLFALDVVRFGATFAGIFVVLFVALNYQSFWQITSAQFSRFVNGVTVDSVSGLSGDTRDLVQALAAEAKRDGDLLSYLPTVGPPEDRIVIPKLRLNVPLVSPSYDALLRQDWTQVETDIQDALQRGVVHYPGTARPGQAGNFFVTGHSSYYPWAPGEYKTVFARLHELQPGDEYWVYYGGDKHRYIVRSKNEVQPSDVSVLDQPSDSRMATLMTCTPIGTTLRRLIVRAEEVDIVTGKPLKVGERAETSVEQRPMLEALPI